MKKLGITSNTVYSLRRKLGWCPKLPATKAQSATYPKDYGQEPKRWGLHIFGRPHMKTLYLTLFLMLIFMGPPTLISILFFHRPNLFPFYSFEVIPVGPSDHIITVENGSFTPRENITVENGIFITLENYFTPRENYSRPIIFREAIFFENGSIIIPNEYPSSSTTRVEVETKPFHLDASQIVEVDYYWLSMDKNGFPFGDYYASLEYRDTNSNITIDELHSQLIDAEGIYQIRENEIVFRFLSPILPWTQGFQLPKAFQDEYVFKLVAYTNATVKPDELIARFVLVYKYKSSITIMGYGINLETIGYTALLLPFAILAAALLFQTIKRKHNRLYASLETCLEPAFLFTGI
jgi:hypothetical protein